jgi:hypothetical protein
MAYKGKFIPTNTKKYRGNPTNIIYRSLWERKFMVYCDLNENILEWGSEEIIIPFQTFILRFLKRMEVLRDILLKLNLRDFAKNQKFRAKKLKNTFMK